MKKVAITLLFLVMGGSMFSQNFEDYIFQDREHPFPEFFPLNFKTPLNVWKESITKPVSITYPEKIIKRKSIKRILIISKHSDTLSEPVNYEDMSQDLIRKQADTIRMLYFYKNGKLKQILYIENLDYNHLLPMKFFKYSGDTTLLISGIGTYYSPNLFYFHKEEKSFLIKDQNTITETDYNEEKYRVTSLYVPERFYIVRYYYKKMEGTNSWFYTSREEELDRCHTYKTEAYLKMNKDSLPYFSYIRYSSLPMKESFLYISQITYERKTIKEIYESKHGLFFNKYESLDSTKLIYSDTLRIEQKRNKSLMQVYLNNLLIFERKKTKRYIIENNYETGEYRYLQLEDQLPVYEYLLKKTDDKYLLYKNIYIYECF